MRAWRTDTSTHWTGVGVAVGITVGNMIGVHVGVTVATGIGVNVAVGMAELVAVGVQVGGTGVFVAVGGTDVFVAVAASVFVGVGVAARPAMIPANTLPR